MGDKIRILLLDGTEALKCSSRSELIEQRQDDLRMIKETPLRCGCRDDFCLRILIANLENGKLAPRAWPKERELHAAGCEAVGDECTSENHGSDSGKGDVHENCERSFDHAYRIQWSDSASTAAIYISNTKNEIQRRLAESFGPDHGLLVGVGLFENNGIEPGTSKNSIPLDFLEMDGKTSRCDWHVPGTVSFATRTDPQGHTLPGLHLVAGIWPRDGSLTHLHAWPIVESGGRIHGRHSCFESDVFAALERGGFCILKPPSECFLSEWDGEYSELIGLLSEKRAWPDFLCSLPSGRLCLVEAAGLTKAQHRLRILEKVEIFRGLEETHDLEWVVVRPDGAGFRIAFSSFNLSIAGLFSGHPLEGAS